MTNQEVINFLDQVREILLDDKSWLESTIQPINEAFDIAISALQTQDLQPTSNQLATDTISRQAAIDALCRRCDLVAEDDEPCTEKCNDIKILEKLPSAQPEIVRCKDCKHRVSYWGNCRLLKEKYHQSVLVDGNSFCSMAERRTDESD